MIVIVDTNIYFSAFYNPEGNEAEIIQRANAEDLTLLSPDIVRKELERVFGSELDWSEEKISSVIRSLPTVWIPKNEYSNELERAKSLISHNEDSPVLACGLRLEIGILTGNTNHFDKPQVREKIPVWTTRKLLDYLNSKENSNNQKSSDR